MEPKELYEKLYGAKMYTNSYEQFRKNYSSDEDISELHRKLKQVKAYDGDLASFKSDYFTPVKKKGSGQGSAFNWETGSVDTSKLSSAPAPAQPAAEKVTRDGVEMDWNTGEVRQSAFQKNTEKLKSIEATLLS